MVMVRVLVPTVNGQVVAAATPLASFTWTVKVPVTVGVPVMAPVARAKCQAGGQGAHSLPRRCTSARSAADRHSRAVYGDTYRKGIVCWASEDGPVTIVKGQVVVATTPLASFTWSVKVPGAVGVPVMAPVLVFSVRPLGSVPVTEKVYGAVPPLTTGAGLFSATPTSPELTAGQVSSAGRR